MTAKLIKEAIKTASDVSGVGGNGINVKTLIDKYASYEQILLNNII